MNNMNREEAMRKAKELYDAGEFEVNGRIYELAKMRHQQRLQVFAFYSEHVNQIMSGNFSCLVGDYFQKQVQKTMFDAVLFEDMQLSKIRDHWEEYPEDFLQVVATAMGVMSYPFMGGASTDSQSHTVTQQKTTLKKPI